MISLTIMFSSLVMRLAGKSIECIVQSFRSALQLFTIYIFSLDTVKIIYLKSILWIVDFELINMLLSSFKSSIFIFHLNKPCFNNSNCLLFSLLVPVICSHLKGSFEIMCSYAYINFLSLQIFWIHLNCSIQNITNKNTNSKLSTYLFRCKASSISSLLPDWKFKILSWLCFTPSIVSNHPDQHVGFSFFNVTVDLPVRLLSISHLSLLCPKNLCIFCKMLKNLTSETQLWMLTEVLGPHQPIW